MIRVMCIACVLVAAAQAAPLAAQASFALADVAFVSGCWAGGDGSTELREQWTEPLGGAMLGTTRFLRDGVVVDWEFGRIFEDGEGVTLWPYPRGVASEHGFGLVRAGEELVFENLLHDYPVRIIYAAERPNGLRVRIEGADGDGQRWSLVRTPC